MVSASTGVTFAVRRLELGEKETSGVYSQYPSMEHFAEMARDEQHHEEKLIEMIDEERLQYMGSVVLGLNDALVEFTGALAGFTLALNDTKLIALTGSITGIAAALSMASSEYLSTKSEKTHNKRPVKAAIYTGIAYIITVVALVGPFILLSSPVLALCIMLVMALLIIAFFNYYYAIARNESFKRRFTEMAVFELLRGWNQFSDRLFAEDSDGSRGIGISGYYTPFRYPQCTTDYPNEIYFS